MQQAAPHWLGNAIVYIVMVGGWLVALYNAVINRKKPAADIHESRARADLAEAEARNKDAATMSEVFETLRLAHKNLDLETRERRELSDKLERYEKESLQLQECNKQLQERNEELENELERYRRMIKLD